MNTDAGRRPPLRSPRALLYLRAALYSTGQMVVTLAFAVAAIAFIPLPYRWRFRAIIQWTHFNIWWLERTCGVGHRVFGLENIPDAPTVVLSKHQSAWETMALSRYFSPLTFVAKRELLRIPFFGWGLATLRPIAIDRSAGRSAMDQVLEQGRARLDDGIWVMVFPEGTRTAPGTRRRYKPGGARLACHLECAVVPVALDSGDFWPRNSFVKYPGTITVVIGAPIPSRGLTPAELMARVETWIEDTVASIRDGSFEPETLAGARSGAPPGAQPAQDEGG